MRKRCQNEFHLWEIKYKRCHTCKLLSQKKYRDSNKLKINEYRKKYYQLHQKNDPNYVKLKSLNARKYYHINKDKCLETIKKYNKTIKAKKYRNKYYAKKLKENIQFYLAARIRSRLSVAIRKNVKSGSIIKELGCSIDELKMFLEKQFEPSMTWKNYGTNWRLTYIIPLSSVDLTNYEELLKVCHYTNLRPLWSK